MKKLAIISNYNEKCGIAQYAANLVKGFSRYRADIEVDLLRIDTSLIKSTREIHKKEKINHWKNIAKKASEYDAVNIQFENGIFGVNDRDVLKSLKILFSSNNNISITMHTIIYDDDDNVGFLNFIKNILSFKLKTAAKCLINTFSKNFLEQFMALVSKNSHVKIIVHTERERKKIMHMYNYNNVYSHPLSFTGAEERKMVGNRGHLEKKYMFEKNDKVISIFGFISEYKGHLVAIKALSQLPEEYKLLIVGSAHPASIKKYSSIDKYIELVINEIVKKKLTDRVVFAGNVPDEELLDIMRTTDISIFPYIEVGQSASGPATMQLEIGGRALFSNALVFDELDFYAKGTLERFDIGNFLQLSDLILKKMKEKPCKENSFNKIFSLESLIDFYSCISMEGGSDS